MRLLHLILGHLSVVIGVIGIFLPLLPTTPFLVVAAFFYSKGSQRFHDWLLGHPRLGPVVRNWSHHGVIRQRDKVLATVFIAGSLSVPLLLFTFHWGLKLLAVGCACGALTFLYTRPSTIPRPASGSADPDRKGDLVLDGDRAG